MFGYCIHWVMFSQGKYIYLCKYLEFHTKNIKNSVFYFFREKNINIIYSHSTVQENPRNSYSYLSLILMNQLFPHSSSSCSSISSGNHNYIFNFCDITYFSFKIPHIIKIMWYLSFHVWLISVNRMSSSSIHVVTNNKISSFLWFSNIPLCIVTPILFTHS